MSLIIIAPTARGCTLALSLETILQPHQIWTKPTDPPLKSPLIRTYHHSVAEVVADCWSQADRLVFVLTTGAVVRLIGPLLGQKQTDPGVVSVDESGRWVISLCGGHVGGGDDLARQVAAGLGVEPVITSAASTQALPAVDLLGQPYGWRQGQGQWVEVAARIARQEPVRVVQTCGWDLWRQRLSSSSPFQLQPDDSLPPQAQIWISDQIPADPSIPTVCWHPRTLWIGVGCERGSSAALIEHSIRSTLKLAGLAMESVAGLASVDLKRDELGVLQVAEEHNWPLQFYSVDQLAAQAVPHPSTQVQAAVGTPSVAEAAALLAAQAQDLVMTKQIYRDPSGACTLAIARAPQELTDRRGQITIIGTGPGDLAQLTLAARATLIQAEVIIGYQLYVDLIRPLLSSEQVIESRPITQEIQRAERAIELAQRGLRVAVISSGDAGIYGMAGLVLECLSQIPIPDRLPVEVLPGISAFQAVAARVGAPLMHDFCAISLSDLLTPWPLIEQRLIAAATADFVVALYNPRSQRRTRGIEIAHQIFLQHRSPQTPVAVARSISRDQEDLHLTSLQDLDITRIDMLTLVLIGNSSTFRAGQHLITPRGYQVTPQSESLPRGSQNQP